MLTIINYTDVNDRDETMVQHFLDLKETFEINTDKHANTNKYVIEPNIAK